MSARPPLDLEAPPSPDGPEDAPAPATHEALLQFLYQAPIGLVQTDVDGRVAMINPMAAQLLMPLSLDGGLDNLFDVLAADAPTLRDDARRSPPEACMLCEHLRVVLPPDAAHPRPRTLALQVMRMDATTLMTSIFDATTSFERERRRMVAMMVNEGGIDMLTSLPNRSEALRRIERALRRTRADPAHLSAVLLINADRFEAVNLSQGHATGDALLRAMAERLGGLVRPDDTVLMAGMPCEEDLPEVPPDLGAARLGGDEFVVVLDGLRQADDLGSVAQRIADMMARPYRVGGQWLHIAASVGAVQCRADSIDADDVLHDATLAMREAKRGGGARCVLFDPGMKQRAAERGHLERELREAISARQLFVVYQPILSLDDGHCEAMEALVRWRHPVRGVVPPLEFIPLAEETGLIGALGLFVLGEACAQLARWQAELGACAPRLMSVNLSRAQLADDRLVDQVREALARNNLPATALELEVTESLAAQGDQMQRRLEALRALGVTLALDDFGTGYSSLACLHQLPVGVLKIDRSFVSRLETSDHHRVLVEATVRVARSLGMATVAEGVETTGQADQLARLGCANGQGYLYARPLAAEDATRWLHGHGVARADAA